MPETMPCGNCGNRRSNFCSTCYFCDSCCNCIECSACAQTVMRGSACSICVDNDGRNNCMNCCTRHITCDHCDSRYGTRDTCTLCQSGSNPIDRCIGCCTVHITCSVCRGRFNRQHMCGVCRRSCNNCCQAVEHRNSSAFQMIPAGPPTFHAGEPTLVLPSKRFIAVELEVAGVRDVAKAGLITKAVRKWGGAIVTDGSISGGELPHEINSAPASGDKFIEQLQETCDALKEAKAFSNKTCGFHVHVDARDFNSYDIRKIVQLYSKLELGMFQMVSPSRRSGNRYCKPCAPTLLNNLENSPITTNRSQLIKNIYGGATRVTEQRTNKYSDARYTAMNLHSWIFRGTIESRLHQGTVNFEKILNWSTLWAGILDFALENSEKDIKSLRGATNAVDSLSTLILVSPTDKVAEWVKSRYEFFKANPSIQESNTDEV